MYTMSYQDVCHIKVCVLSATPHCRVPFPGILCLVTDLQHRSHLELMAHIYWLILCSFACWLSLQTPVDSLCWRPNLQLFNDFVPPSIWCCRHYFGFHRSQLLPLLLQGILCNAKANSSTFSLIKGSRYCCLRFPADVYGAVPWF